MLITHKQSFSDTIVANKIDSYQYVLYREGNPKTPTLNTLTISSKEAVNHYGHRLRRKYDRSYVEASDIDVMTTLDKGINSTISLEEIKLDYDPIRYVNGYKLSIKPLTLDNITSYANDTSLGNIVLRNIKTGEVYGSIETIKKDVRGRLFNSIDSYKYGDNNSLASNNYTDINAPLTLFTTTPPITSTIGFKVTADTDPVNIANYTGSMGISNVADGNYGNLGSTENNSGSKIFNLDSKSITITQGSKLSYGATYMLDGTSTTKALIADVIPLSLHSQGVSGINGYVLDLSNNTSTAFTVGSQLPNTMPLSANNVVMVDTNINIFSTDSQITIYPNVNSNNTTTYNYTTIQIHNNSSVLSGTILDVNATLGNIENIYNGSTAISSKRELETYVNVFPMVDSFGKVKIITLANTNGKYNANTSVKIINNKISNTCNTTFSLNYLISDETIDGVIDTMYAHVDKTQPLIINVGDTVYIPIIHSAINYTPSFTTLDGCSIEFTKDINPIQGYKKYRVDGDDKSIYNHIDSVDGGLYITGVESGTAEVKVETDRRVFEPIATHFTVKVLPDPDMANIELETNYLILTSNSSKRVAFYIDKCKDVEVEFIYNKEYTITHRLYKYYNHETQEMSGYVVIQPLPYDAVDFDSPIPFQVVVRALCDEKIIGTNSFKGKIYPRGQHAIEIKDIDDVDVDIDIIINNIQVNGTNPYTVMLYTTTKYIMSHDHVNTTYGYKLEETGGIYGTYINLTIDTTELEQEYNNVSNSALRLLYPNSKMGYRNNYKLYGLYRDHIERLYDNAVQFELAKKEAQEHIFRYDSKYFTFYPNTNITNGYIRFAGYDSYSAPASNGLTNYTGNGIVVKDLPINNISNTTIPTDEVWVTLQHRDTSKNIDYIGTDTNYTIFKWKDRRTIEDIYGHKIYLPSVSGKLLTSLNDISKQTSKKYFTKSAITKPSASTNLTKGSSWLDTSTGKVWVCRDDTTNYNYWYAYPEQIVGNVTLHSYPRVGIGNIPLDILDTLPIIPLDGCYDINSSNYGNYKDRNNNILVYIPAVYVDNSDNLSGYKKENYNKHSFFNNSIGILVPKYPIPENASGAEYSKENRVKATNIRDDLLDEIKEASGLNIGVTNNGDDLRDLLTTIKGNSNLPNNDFNNLITTNNLHTHSGVVYDKGVRYHIYIKEL